MRHVLLDEIERDNLHKPISRRDMIKRCAFGIFGISAVDSVITLLMRNADAAVESAPTPAVFKGGAPKTIWKWSKEAYHTRKINGKYKCGLCPNMCTLEEGDRGFCRVRVHRDGKMYTLAYGNAVALHIDPIEKKPLNHFFPGTAAFSIATAGCNFRCLNCQNWDLSQKKPEETAKPSDPLFEDFFPAKVVELAEKAKCRSIAYTYSEPSVFYEYMYDTSKIAHEKGIKNLWITNGYMNQGPLIEFCEYLDAANVDLKSFDDGIYKKLNAGRLQPVLDTLTTLAEQKVWFEITNLVVPTYTDDLKIIREMCKWLFKNIGPDYPLHFSRCYPLYKLTHLPMTPAVTLKKARDIAMEEGLHYVYVGNVPGADIQNTICPKCGKTVVERKGYLIIQNNIESGKCKFCSEKISGIWQDSSEKE